MRPSLPMIPIRATRFTSKVVMLNLFQHPPCLKHSPANDALWTLCQGPAPAKQVEGDESDGRLSKPRNIVILTGAGISA
ncbi:hypothetical protein ABTM70_20795, partial [Acinetobacter baumannii]